MPASDPGKVKKLRVFGKFLGRMKRKVKQEKVEKAEAPTGSGPSSARAREWEEMEQNIPQEEVRRMTCFGFSCLII